MNIELDKEGLCCLVQGVLPSYDIMEHPLVKKCGRYYGGMNDHWEWYNGSLILLSEEELYELYKICSESWKVRK